MDLAVVAAAKADLAVALAAEHAGLAVEPAALVAALAAGPAVDVVVVGPSRLADHGHPASAVGAAFAPERPAALDYSIAMRHVA